LVSYLIELPDHFIKMEIESPVRSEELEIVQLIHKHFKAKGYRAP